MYILFKSAFITLWGFTTYKTQWPVTIRNYKKTCCVSCPGKIILINKIKTNIVKIIFEH